MINMKIVFVFRYIDRLLRNIDPTHVVYSPSQKCFIQIAKDASLIYNAPDEYINYTGILLKESSRSDYIPIRN